MARPPKLASAEIAAALEGVHGWTLEAGEGAISRIFTFRNFSEAFGFMARAALAAEKLDHHPEWSNVYKTVEVRLSTHDAGGLTELDFTLARRMDKIVGG